eukprot:3214737-Ditylum_brightwellii.AAC.1
MSPGSDYIRTISEGISYMEEVEPTNYNIAVDLNNIAVALLKKQHDEFAISTFKKANEAMKLEHQFSEIEPKRTKINESEPNDSFILHLIKAKECLIVTEFNRDHNTITHDGMKQSTFRTNDEVSSFMYTRPIEIDCTNENSNEESVSDAALSRRKEDVAIILYNIALCYHIQGTKTGKQELLETALKTYEMACQAIQDHQR